MATIRIADEIRPVKSNATGISTGVAGGVYSRHDFSRISVGRRSASRVSIDRTSEKLADHEDIEDDQPGLRQEGDYKERQVTLCLQPYWDSSAHVIRCSKERFYYGLRSL